uniref:Uncharacterized protein n=1 Tax=Chromera velia CCMP2878 TaxID=1169474 RepID=A0A0G4G9T1_9ALVE|eukprot:Cvel_4379.t1-p1 / transcript=Cvel_4379.t1 / gene=Cvel_4379 / organism=Chromera_velia_CCMP2878 / gene_product=hypothetical protein / transcript_product=hypothetical protein / location=Cvel_scaffold190:6785-11080(+) / protein_length=782 / sequence_SO=supercontig / SO=protein_coding / is_pseudo=false
MSGQLKGWEKNNETGSPPGHKSITRTQRSPTELQGHIEGQGENAVLRPSRKYAQQTQPVHDTVTADQPAALFTKDLPVKSEETAPESSSDPPPPSEEEVLSLLLEHGGPFTQVTAGRDLFGMTWTSLRSIEMGAVRGAQLRSVDLSACSLSPGKAALLLLALPSSTEELVLGPAMVRGRALLPLCQFMDRRVSGCISGAACSGDAPRLKSLAFAKHSIGFDERAQVFSRLPEGLESFALEDDYPDTVKAPGLVSAIQSGRLNTLKSLKLHKFASTEGLDEAIDAVLKAMSELEEHFPCESTGEFPLKLETLWVPWTRSHVQGGNGFGAWLECKGMSSVRELRLSLESNMGYDAVSVSLYELFRSLRSGFGESLESLHLDLRDRFCGGGYPAWMESSLGGTGWMCPRLKNLTVLTEKLHPFFATFLILAATGAKIGQSGLDTIVLGPRLYVRGQARWQMDCFEVLNDVEKSVLLAVKPMDLVMENGGVYEAEVLLSGRLPFLRPVELLLRGPGGAAFLGALVSASSVPTGWEWVKISFVGESEEADSLVMSAFVDALGMGRMGWMGEVSFRADIWEGRFKGDWERLWPVFACVRFPVLSVLDLSRQMVGDGGMAALGEGVRSGNFPQLRRLLLERNEFGREGMRSFFGAVADTGLPLLECIDLCGTRAGEGASSLAECLKKTEALPSLKELQMRRCRLSDEGLHSLGRAFAVNRLPSLTSLGLLENFFHYEGVEAFCSALTEESLPNLVSFHIDLNAFPQAAVQTLLRAEQEKGKLRSLRLPG